MRFALPVFFIVMVSSCLDEPDCIRNADTALVIQFKRLLDGKNDTLIFYRVEAIGTDSIFYGQDPDVLDTLRGTPMILSVNPNATSTSFTFYLPVLERSLSVEYDRSVRFISEDCGSEVSLSNLRISFTDFDSVRVINPILSTARTVNIEIYR
ncbi:MAG: hypothetical protein HRU69_05890 [Flammeovirgaceae bacterium]|nr:MAG: hypothetical protein HRU69_05890 [Flammeovirgaceae bacterium]